MDDLLQRALHSSECDGRLGCVRRTDQLGARHCWLTPPHLHGQADNWNIPLISPSCTSLIYKIRERTHMSKWSWADWQNRRSKHLAESQDKHGRSVTQSYTFVTDAAQGLGCFVLGQVTNQWWHRDKNTGHLTSGEVLLPTSYTHSEMPFFSGNPARLAGTFLVSVVKLAVSRIYLQTILAVSGPNNILA